MNVMVSDVVKVEDKGDDLFVVIDCKDHEEAGHCLYRMYKIIPLDTAIKHTQGNYKLDEDAGEWIHVTAGGFYPEIAVQHYVPPFEVKQVMEYRIRKMTPKVITTYE